MCALAKILLAMAAPDGTALFADREPPAAAQPAPLENRAAVLGLHSLKETMLTTTWDAFWLPGSLWHCRLYLSPMRHGATQVLIAHC